MGTGVVTADGCREVSYELALMSTCLLLRLVVLVMGVAPECSTLLFETTPEVLLLSSSL